MLPTLVVGLLTFPGAAAFADTPADSRVEPAPGGVFRDFVFQGARFAELDPACTRDFPPGPFRNKPRMVPKEIELDLEQAVRAEMCVEYWGGHIGTAGQQFRLNEGEWIDVPQPQTTPTPPQCYYRTLRGRPATEIPLGQLKHGKNVAQFRAGAQIKYGFDWGFYWIYSFTIRVHYQSTRPHPTGRIVAPASGAAIGDHPQLVAQASSPNGAIRQVDFIGEYEDFNWEGDGRFRQWHSITRQGVMDRHIGTATKPPFKATWNTQWLPDQREPVRLMARIVDETGMCAMTPAVEGIRLQRAGRSVRMYRCDEFPENFSARAGKSKTCAIVIGDDPGRAAAARLVASTWSAATDTRERHEIAVNGRTVGDNFGLFHDHSFATLKLPVEALKQGANEVTIHSVFKGHALEINWPGPVFLLEFNSGE